MGDVTHGMDVGDVESLGRLLQRQSERLRGLTGDVDRLVRAVAWSGGDATAFLEMWPTHRARLTRAAEGLHGLGQSALNNASEQREVSAVWGGHHGSFAAPRTLAGASDGTINRSLRLGGWAEGERLWHTLSEEEQTRQARRMRGMGNNADYPPVVRDAINRERIRVLLAQLPHTPEHTSRRWVLEQSLRSDAQVIFFDPEGDGRIALAHGDIVRSPNVAVQVPGISNTLDNVFGLVGNSERLLAQSGAGTAVVTWLGYDTPSVGVGAATPDLAMAGAKELQRFVGVLDSQRPDARITVIGHSYGSVVTSLAAAGGLPADNVVLVGSPGAGLVPASQFSDGHGGRPAVYVGQTSSDYVSNGSAALVPGPISAHGIDPMSSAFGADERRQFTHLDVRSSHSAYYTEGSDQLSWLSKIVTGR